MPELPEVETVCRGLAQHITGKTIASVIARRRDLRMKLPDDFEKKLAGRKVTSITRRAKYILIHLDNSDILIIHLGMSGSMVLHEKPPEMFRKHDHVILEFSPYTLMTFHDPRRFGLMAIANKKNLTSHKLLAGLGKEPLDKDTDGNSLHAILRGSKSAVKLAIMDQARIVGVGNIYASEALFRAGIHPERIANTITKKEAGLLMTSIKKVLEEAIESGGSTLRDYVRSSGDTGYFQHHFSVYGRAKLPCVTCKTPVSSLRQGSRSTFLCKTCQK